ncbi:MAG: isoprenylcysteine carboxylmethyltransferase family protein [Syntrophaceae bacterium]
MKALLKKLNDLPIFDPIRWPQRELLARLTGTIICTAFIIHRILKFTQYTGHIPPFLRHLADGFGLFGFHLGAADWHWIMWCAVWMIETGIFAGYILAFATRSQARSVARGFMEVVFPLSVAALPVVITLTPMNFQRLWPPLLMTVGDRLAAHGLAALSPLFWSWEPAFFLLLAIIICGGAINLIGLITLRRAFTIMSEARFFIHRGIFKLVRHPLYAGHFVMFFGYLMFHLYGITLLLYLCFLAGQYLRARIEEAKLVEVFPEYEGYRRATGMFFPRLKR